MIIKGKSFKEYFIYAVIVGDYLKIGISTNPNKRIQAYKTSSPKVRLIGYFSIGERYLHSAKQKERNIHKKLRKYRIEREIFSLDAIPYFREIKKDKRKPDGI